MSALDELMRKCREDGHQVTYGDLVELHKQQTAERNHVQAVTSCFCCSGRGRSHSGAQCVMCAGTGTYLLG